MTKKDAPAAASDEEVDVDFADDETRLTTTGNAARRSGTLRKVLVGAAAIAVVAGAVLVIMLTTDHTRAVTVNVPAKFSAQFSSQGNDHPEFTYTGRIHKDQKPNGDWIVQAEVEGVDPTTKRRTRVILLDNRAYYEEFATADATTPSKTGCYDPARVPPLADIDDVFNGAVQVPEGEIVAAPVAGACSGSDGDMYALSWGTEVAGLKNNIFYYCQTASDAHQLIGREFVATVFNFNTAPESDLGLTIPTDATTGEPLTCDELPELSALDAPSTATSRRRLGLGAPLTKKPRRRLPGSTVECYFIHGSGPSADLSASSSFSDYWGSVQNQVGSDCDEVKFMQRDYLSVEWDDPQVAADFCDETASGHGTSVKDRILFTHGYGTLAVANAFYTGECTKDSSTDWYSIGTPWLGSYSANAASTICSSYAALTGDINDDIGMCSGSSASPAMLSQQTTYSSPSVTFSTLSSYARTNVDGAMCGWNMWGLMAGSGQELESVVDIASWPAGTWHDGFTPTAGCKNLGTQDDTFSVTSSGAVNYAVAVNFVDLTCRNGNAFLDIFNAASPCHYYATVT